jgi:hypothetical protein
MTEDVKNESVVVSPKVREIIGVYAKQAKWPKEKIRRLNEGESDNEPLIQAFALLDTYHTDQNSLLERQLEDLTKRVDETAEAFKTERSYNSTYLQTLQNIIKRAKGSFFGKGKAIEEMAQKAIEKVEGPYKFLS